MFAQLHRGLFHFSPKELIFWDYASTDNSKKVIEEFKDTRIKYYKSEKYLKLYNARNLAIQKANGKFITFLDTDDWWDENKLQKQVSLFSNNKDIGFTYTNFFMGSSSRPILPGSLVVVKDTNSIYRGYKGFVQRVTK